MYSKLYTFRRENRLKQREVAKRIGIHPQSYHLKESGKREFTISEGKQLARLFNCTLNDLFEDDKYIVEKSSDTISDESLKELTYHLEQAVNALKKIINKHTQSLTYDP